MTAVSTGSAPLPQFTEVAARVKQELSAERFAHVQRVVATAEELARAHKVPVAEARLAAVLHDVLRESPADRLLRFVAARGLLADDPALARYPLLLHGPAGALWSRDRWPLPRPVLLAIAYHITGHPGMDALAQTIFVADYTEPGRTFPAADQVRSLARRALEPAVLAAAEGTMEYLLARSQRVHPQLLETRNAFLKYRDAGHDDH